MIFNDYYDIDIYYNNTSLEISPLETYFSMHDSIHSFFNEANLQLNDPYGILNEHLVSMEGNIFGIYFGVPSVSFEPIKNNFVIYNSEIPENQSIGIMNGKLNINLLHEYYNLQEVRSEYYNSMISTIVSQVVSDYSFKSTNIKQTNGSTVWYQLDCNQKDFITKTLLPNAYSNTANNTPFFAFIDNGNIFNFISYDEMMSKNPIANLTYTPINKDGMSINSIYDIKPFSTGSLKTKQLRNRKVIYRSTVTGEFSTQYDTIKNYPKQLGINTSVPIVSKNNLITDINYQHFQYTEKGEKESVIGRLVDSERDGFFLERLIVTLPFNPLLKSGLTVNMEISILNELKTPEYSLYYSDKYLIEDCKHSWTGGTIKKGMTQLIVSRKFSSIPTMYTIKEKVL